MTEAASMEAATRDRGARPCKQRQPRYVNPAAGRDALAGR
jgi:hypothetical protein